MNTINLPNDSKLPLDENGSISAQVIVKSESGIVLSDPEMITSESLDQFLPSIEMVNESMTIFRDLGFEVGPIIGISYSIGGPVQLFEDVFDVVLLRTEQDNIRIIIAKDQTTNIIPLTNMPASLEPYVQFVLFSPPLDFGPGNFFE